MMCFTTHSVTEKDGPQGVLLIDDKAVCIASRGTLGPDAAGSATSIVVTAQHIDSLVKNNRDNVFIPSITIETERSTLMLEMVDGITTVFSFANQE